MPIFRLLGRYCLAILFASVFLGLGFPDLAEILKPALPFGVFGIVLGALLRVDRQSLSAELRRPMATLALSLWAIAVLPLLVMFIGRWIVPVALLGPLVVVLSTPTGSTNAPVAAALGGNVTLAVLASVVTVSLAPLTVPLIVAHLDVASEFAPAATSLRLLLLTAGSAVIAILVRWAGHDARASGLADSCTSVGLAIFGIGAMAGIGSLIWTDPVRTVHYAAIATGSYVVVGLMGYALFRLGGSPRAITGGLASASRNMGFAWAAIGLSGAPETYLFLACYMLPVHTMPFILETVSRLTVRHHLLKSARRIAAPHPGRA